ncbi:hypothetical protein [Haladaptatus pallidirubidus]|uniref:HVO-0513-like N-terminal domain-containing protein n=1 Tax=Haladaptatus pallidirubidus TaxID=1008152 RepID=A0AAV3UP12_9EURY
MIEGRFNDHDHERPGFQGNPNILHYDIPNQEDGLVYLHCEMNESLTALLSAVQQSEVYMAMPIEFLSDDHLRLTFIEEHKPHCC